MADPRAIVLFDGVCNLCNGTVQFIIDRDPEGRFAFASLQSRIARELLAAHGRDAAADPETVLLIEDGVVYDRSTAALRIARRLRGAARLTYPLAIVPRGVRDAMYRVVASNRYRWFGRREVCRVPTAENRGRFLDEGEGRGVGADR